MEPEWWWLWLLCMSKFAQCTVRLILMHNGEKLQAALGLQMWGPRSLFYANVGGGPEPHFLSRSLCAVKKYEHLLVDVLLCLDIPSWWCIAV